MRNILEFLGAPVLRLSLEFAKLYRPSFHTTSTRLYRVADKARVYPVIDHYHEPMAFPAASVLADRTPRLLPGVDLHIDTQLSLLAQFTYNPELEAISSEYQELLAPYYRNPSFPPGDAQTLHNMIRHLSPRQVVEIGSGESSRFIANALRANAAHGEPGTLECIEPYEAPWLEQLGVTVLRTTIEALGGDAITTCLHAGDVLVIDSSHVARSGGDVPFIYGELIPRLRPGVVVHIHDIFTPRHYPSRWLSRRWLWDEQYVVEALLTDNANLRVLLSVNHLFHDYRAQLAQTCPMGLTGPFGEEPCSLWIEVRPQSSP